MIFTRQPEPTKWLEFIHLCDAFDVAGCPICTLVEKACYRHLDHLFYESVNDVGTRERLAASRGFCNAHAHLALRVPNPDSGLAIIYADLLRHPDQPATATCPVCDTARFTAHTALSELLRWFTDAELQTKYRPSFGLCLPHLRQARAEFPGHENLPALVAAEEEKLTALRAELQEYTRKLDYRFADEPKGREQTSWRRVVDKFTGGRAGMSLLL
jgi:hypothetical protein